MEPEVGLMDQVIKANRRDDALVLHILPLPTNTRLPLHLVPRSQRFGVMIMGEWTWERALMGATVS